MPHVVEALASTTSKRKALRLLGCDDRNGNEMILLNEIIRRERINIDHHSSSRGAKRLNFKECVKGCFTFLELAKKVGLISLSATKAETKNYRKLQKWIKEESLDTSHFQREYKKEYYRYISSSDVFRKNSNASNATVKARFLKITEYKCTGCSISEWNDKRLNLQLDHIDGDSSNHELSNLRLLCPNCHSQTETFGAKQRKRKKEKV